MKIGLAKVIECEGRWAVTSLTKAPRSALLASNAHVQVFDSAVEAAALGAAIRLA